MLFSNISNAKLMLVYFTAQMHWNWFSKQESKFQENNFNFSQKFCLILPQNRQFDFAKIQICGKKIKCVHATGNKLVFYFGLTLRWRINRKWHFDQLATAYSSPSRNDKIIDQRRNLVIHDIHQFVSNVNLMRTTCRLVKWYPIRDRVKKKKSHGRVALGLKTRAHGWPLKQSKLKTLGSKWKNGGHGWLLINQQKIRTDIILKLHHQRGIILLHQHNSPYKNVKKGLIL